LLCNEIKDTFLDIEDIKRVAVSLGNNLTLLQIDLALHDIFLCPKAFRKKAFEKMSLGYSKFRKLAYYILYERDKNRLVILN
jgi:hypothetical protein